MPRSRTLAGLALAFLMLTPLAGILPAQASEAEEKGIAKTILEAISEDRVTVIEPATISNLELLRDQGFSGATSIVAVKRSALEGYEPQELSDYILEKESNGYGGALSFLVVEDSQGEKIYFSSNSEDLTRDVGDLLGVGDSGGPVSTEDAGWELVRNGDKIYNLQTEHSGGGAAALVVGIVFGSMLVGGFLIWGIVEWILRFRRGSYSRTRRRQARQAARAKKRADQKSAKEAARQKAQEEKLAKKRAESLVEVPADLSRLANSLKKRAEELNQSDTQLSRAISAMLSRFTELREAVTLMEVQPARRTILFMEYTHRFETLETLAGPRYYEDLKRNPEHWRETDKKLEAIRMSFQRTETQLLENIIQLKEGSEFDFELAIDGILGFKVVNPRDLLS